MESIQEEAHSQHAQKRQHEEETTDEKLNRKRLRDGADNDDGVQDNESAEDLVPEVDTEAANNEITKFSDSIFVYKNKKLSNHGNVFEGGIRSGVYGVRVCAIKLNRKSDQNIREAEILTKLSPHTNVISIIQSGIYKDAFEERVYIVLDKCHKQNLHQHLTYQNDSGAEFNFTEALGYCKQIIAGMTYVHEKLIIHKDLKPSNILLTHDKSTIKLADFGLSEEIKSTSSKVYNKHQFGTNGYRPVESFGNNWVSLKSDVFSLGVVLYFILSNGKSPFGDEIHLWTYKIKNGVIDLSHLVILNANSFRHLIALMLSKERCGRPSIRQVADHPCWTGQEDECNFDYGYEEEVDDSDGRILEIEEQDSSGSKSEMELAHEFLRALYKMGLWKRTQVHRSSIILFIDEPRHLKRFNPENKTLTRMQDFNSEMNELNNFSAVSVGKYIYVLARDSLYRLNHNDSTAAWERMADPISDHGNIPPAVACSGAIYVVGAANGGATKSASKYDPTMDRCEKLKDKKLATYFGAVVASKGFIYCIGGGGEGISVTTNVERMDETSQTWNNVAPMRGSRWGATAVECNGGIIVAGGFGRNYRVHLNSVERYNAEVNQWTVLKPMKTDSVMVRCLSVGREIFAVFVSQNKSEIEKYDIEKDEWKTFHDLETGMNICESVVVTNA